MYLKNYLILNFRLYLRGSKKGLKGFVLSALNKMHQYGNISHFWRALLHTNLSTGYL